MNDKPNTATEEKPHALAAATLTGDLRDFILDRLHHFHDPLPWSMKSEASQRELARDVTTSCRTFVENAVEIIAGEGQRTIKATIDQIVVKDGIKAVLMLSKHDPGRHVLTDAVGSTVLIVIADADQFTGEREPVKITPDQASLIGPGGMAQHSDPED